ncbi:calmodulin-binding protein 60 C-like [Bidens hawaiensis]|uniref:calmodulin-binding protein 60 C-like n=1 Tax=Bidens hawaiensis TaxID=980011 RepID=UPI00404AF91B
MYKFVFSCSFINKIFINEKIMEKRRLDQSGSGGDSEEGQPEKKRPALASVIVEALKMDSLQKLCSSLEPILRRVVSEEVERALAKLGPPKLSGRVSPKRLEGSDGRDLQLQFKSKISVSLFMGGKVEGDRGAAIHVVLIDANTGHVVTSGPESSVKLEIVVLEGDFNNEDEKGWTQEEFETHMVKERDGKRPLLSGDVQVALKEGVGTLGELTFTDNSSWIRSRKFRLGLKVASGYNEGARIREAKTDAFTVKDHRGELYKKHYPPALADEVWRLEKIGKDGSFHKKLNKAGIFIVEDFLRLVVRDQKKLRSFDATSFTFHNPLINGSQQPLGNDNNLLALGLTQPSTPNFLSGNTNTLNLSSSFRGLDDYFPEEEIRMRSHEMLENDDMRHLLWLFNNGQSQTSGSQVNESYYPYSTGYMPNTPSFGYGLDVDKTRSSGKAVVGWLKLKAALRWGIFIRKQAAERRAQIVELEDDP